MRYFSYNDFIDCTENEKVEEITKVAENITKYEQINGVYKVQKNEEKIIKILKEKIELKKFLKEFLKLQFIESIIYYNSNKPNTLISKIKEKEIFIYIKVIENIDNNITYKMFEKSMEIIKRWNKTEKIENKRYPIVIPILIYIGKTNWKENNNRTYNKIKYITYENNRINFSYNIIKIQKLTLKELQQMKSKVAKEFIKIKSCNKNKYLQIN